MSDKAPPPVPRPRVTTLFGGVAIVAAGLAAWWYGLLRQQARKDDRGAYQTWEYRILQAQAAAGNPDRPTTSRQSDDPTATSPPDRPAPGMLATHSQSESDAGTESSQARVDKAVPNAPQTNSGIPSDPNTDPRPEPEPTPRRARENGRVYRYVDDYDEQAPEGH